MSKITNDGLARSATGCYIAVPIWISGRKRVKILNKLRKTLCCTSAQVVASTELW